MDMAPGARLPRGAPRGAVFTRPSTFRHVNIRAPAQPEGTLADIFVSYSRLDHERVKPIVDRLESLGYSVWCEPRESAAAAAVQEVEAQLDQAKAVLTLWSANARNSSWVHAEAARAFDAGKLAQARLDAVELP